MNLNGWLEVRVDKVQAQSPTITRGAKSWRSSAAETGPPLGWLLRCLRLASLELEGGERRREEPVAVTTNGISCCCCSSIPSCSASCRFTAMALSENNVRSRALLVLWDKKRQNCSSCEVHIMHVYLFLCQKPLSDRKFPLPLMQDRCWQSVRSTLKQTKDH